MHVGKGVFFQNRGDKADDAAVVRHEYELADEAERLGFESLWAAEHHFDGYHMCPNVMQALTYLAARTERVRLGSMVVVLPWHDPVRVAEELSVVDHLSGGRLMLGLGRGLGRIEFEGFRLDMGESRQRFIEYADAVVRSFDDGILQSDGTLYRQPPVEIRPTPLAPLRGRVYASAVSPESMDIMARLGFGIMVIAQKPWSTTEAEVASYRDRFVELNGCEPPRPLLVSFVTVHESEQGADEMFERYLVGYAQSCLEHYEFDNQGLADIPGYEYYGRLADNIEKHGADAFVRFLADLQPHGTPDQVVEQITTNVRRLDAAGVVAVQSFGGMAPEVSRANHELFASAVMPRLQAIDTDRVLPDIGVAAAAG